MGMAARVPWIAFITPEMEVSEVFQSVILRRVEGNGETPPQLGTWSQDN